MILIIDLEATKRWGTKKFRRANMILQGICLMLGLSYFQVVGGYWALARGHWGISIIPRGFGRMWAFKVLKSIVPDVPITGLYLFLSYRARLQHRRIARTIS